MTFKLASQPSTFPLPCWFRTSPRRESLSCNVDDLLGDVPNQQGSGIVDGCDGSLKVIVGSDRDLCDGRDAFAEETAGRGAKTLRSTAGGRHASNGRFPDACRNSGVATSIAHVRDDPPGDVPIEQGSEKEGEQGISLKLNLDRAILALRGGDRDIVIDKEVLKAIAQRLLWHQRLAHIGDDYLDGLDRLVTGMPLLKRLPIPHICNPCIGAKAHKRPIGRRVTHRQQANASFELVHVDIMHLGEEIGFKLNEKSSYVIGFTDDYSNYRWIYSLAAKSYAHTALKAWLEELDRLRLGKPKMIQMDQATELRLEGLLFVKLY